LTDVALTLPAVDRNRVLGGLLAAFAIWVGAFLSGFVINEPAPYELYMVGLVGIWVLCGLRFPAAIMPLLVLLIVFNIGGVISMMTMTEWRDAPMYVAVGFFLAFTAIFFAAVIAADGRRAEIIMNGYLTAAVLTGLLGIVGYFNLVPGADLFTRYGRAMGAFQDPNVFAPFLALPAIYCLHGVLTRSLEGALWRLPMLIVLSFAIFLSFSRAGWGLFVLCALLLTAFLLIASPSHRFRLRIAALAATAFVAVVIALLIAIQIEAVREMLIERARLQDYDSGQSGRFANHLIGYMKATEHPFGIGPLEFGERFGADTHNIWLKALFDYSWLGFASYVTLVVWTLGAGLRIVFRDRPWQPILVCALIVFFGHALIGNVIDTDRWRHLFLIFGVIWGCIALEARHQREVGLTLRHATA
jgi:O-antigen ligase